MNQIAEYTAGMLALYNAGFFHLGYHPLDLALAMLGKVNP